jgi:hypothetical protein
MNENGNVRHYEYSDEDIDGNRSGFWPAGRPPVAPTAARECANLSSARGARRHDTQAGWAVKAAILLRA